MAIKTSRTDENAAIIIDYSKCKACGLCVSACKDLSLIIKDGKLAINDRPVFGCLGCGQCAAICPNEAIHLEGRTLSKGDFIKMPDKETMAGYEPLRALMLGRRSVRDFKPREIESDVIDKIINAASTAPMGIPPSDVKVLVLKGRAKVREFSFDFLDQVKSMKWFFSPAMLLLLRPFIGRDNYEAFKSFIKPLIDGLLDKRAQGEDWL
ncbi:MAG TPA: 4Fe-4S binding protein, partial [Planctomycetota bacterium]|nr:4Fe-4S binding protein [Planctomycetota bacterium]